MAAHLALAALALVVVFLGTLALRTSTNRVQLFAISVALIVAGHAFYSFFELLRPLDPQPINPAFHTAPRRGTTT